MIKDNNNYLYLIVPNEYRCIYYNILDTLGTLGEDLLSSCTATCKGRAISGFACYNMFMAACACYYLGQVKRARVLINYIKAQLEIDCNKNIIFEDSLSDEWVYLKVPAVYQCVFTKLLDRMSTWGQELLDDCTTSCKGKNRNILNSWNLFQAAVIAYEYGNITKADAIVDNIARTLGFNCEEEPTVKYYNIDVVTNPSSATVRINGILTKSTSLPENTAVTIVASLSGYYDKTVNINSLVKDEVIEITFTDDDKIPTATTYTVTIGTPTPSNAKIKVNGVSKNIGDTLIVQAGTSLIVTAEASGYEPYSETIIVNSDKTIAPVLTPITIPNYTYQVIVKVNDEVVDDANITLTNKTTNESVNSDRITVPNNTTVGVIISKLGYKTQNFNRVITEDKVETVNLVEDDDNVYIQINGSKEADNQEDVTKVKVYVKTSSIPWTEIPNNTPYQITPGKYCEFEVIPVDDNGDPDLINNKPVSKYYSASKTSKLVGTTIEALVCPKRNNEWLYILKPAKDGNGNIIENAKYWDGANHLGVPNPQTASPLGFSYTYYDNTVDYPRHVGVTAGGYEGVDYDIYNPEHNDITVENVLQENSNSFLIVSPCITHPYGGGSLNDNIILNPTDPYKNNFTVYPSFDGFYSGKANIRSYIFVNSNLDTDKSAKEINDIGTAGVIPGGGPSGKDTTPVSIVFDNPIGRVGADGFNSAGNWCGPQYFRIIFDVTEENYQAGLQIVATISDGVNTRNITFVMPTIPEYED